ncbi:helix-turn-helix transcriptional regulator [Merdimmobilis hominis]|jgi:predicted transcriptional regulator YheO|uniref:YheO-like PAS domain protein n=1 Tax=uncultured Anaerotruncus sp. TaxID=905011 RepID=A0A6N2UCW1_9FIRM|nr:PAS domain-containing protein [Merdimmobilis hominis]MCD4835328.1 PAS domain-containing protein [Merdimmobilis hominis]PWL64664.1 MAG: transcriptional regulator [Oscillospiraceae bacterium]
MNKVKLAQYTALVKFLGAALGPDYEIVLHDINGKDQSVAAIANGRISGRNVGAPLTDKALRFIADKTYQDQDFLCNYTGRSKDERTLRASTMFIKDDGGRLIGMLCINFDPSRYQKASQDILKLCGLDGEIFLEDNHLHPAGEVENFSDSISEVTDTVLKRYLKDGIPPERLTQEEKMAIVKQLEERGIFLLKGAVNEVATRLHCSAASIYRYLGKINKQNESGN